MKEKIVVVTRLDLQEYMQHIQGKSEKISLNEFLANKHHVEDGVAVMADLSQIAFSKESQIDLTGANLSGTILDGIEFNKYVTLKQVDLRGASLRGCTFIDNIDLEGTKFGSIILDSKMFKRCKLALAEYDPNAPKVVMVAVTDKQLEAYKKLRKEGVAVAQGSLNEYLKQVLRHNFPEDFAIIADLSERTIDSSFDNCDLTGSSLRYCDIKGTISNLILRDCYFNQTEFHNCNLINVDLRGTSLSMSEHIGQEFIAARFIGDIIFISPKFGIDKDIEQAQQKGLLPKPENGKLTIAGNPVFEPCYQKGVDTVAPKQNVKVTRAELEEFAAYCLESSRDIGFKSYIMEQRHIISGDIMVDLSSLDLRNLNLSSLKFEGCNFSYALLSGSNLEKAKFTNCNFSGADFSKKIGGFLRSAASLKGAEFNDCNFTCADVSGVNASNAVFQNLLATNLMAAGFNLENAKANNANFEGAWLYGMKAEKLEAKQVNMGYAFSKNANYTNANLSRGNFSYGDFTNANFTDADCSYTNFLDTNLRRANLTRTNFNQARLAADLSKAKLIETTLEDADLAGMFYKEASQPEIQGVDFSKAIECEEKYKLQIMQAEQQKERNARSVYNRYAFFIVLALIILSMAMLYMLPAVLALYFAVPLGTLTTVVAGGIIAEKVIGNKFGVELGLTDEISNLLGAKKVISLLNAPQDREIERCQKEIESHYIEEDKDGAVKSKASHIGLPSLSKLSPGSSTALSSDVRREKSTHLKTPLAVEKSMLQVSNPQKAVEEIKKE